MRVRLTRLRRRIAERLKAAQNTAAMLTTFNEIDMTEAISLRERHRDSFEKKHGVRLGFMSIFLKAAIVALKELPTVNAEIDGDDIVYKNHYDIGVAVEIPSEGWSCRSCATPTGWALPGHEQTIAALGRKARDGKLTIEDLFRRHVHHQLKRAAIFGSLDVDADPEPAAIRASSACTRSKGGPSRMGDEVEIRPMMYRRALLRPPHRRRPRGRDLSWCGFKECAIEEPSRILFEM